MRVDHTHVEEPTLEGNELVDGPTKMTRREALAAVGKHAIYTAPAVLAVLSVTKSKSAHAVPTCSGNDC